MAKYFIIFFLLLFLPLLLNAQYNNIKFEHLSVDDGLSNNIVNSILQDSQGFMWICTEDGLNKYDGYSFTVYRHDPEDSLSISDNNVYALHESKHCGKPVLWVGTQNGGLNRLDLETEQFTHYRKDTDDPQSLSNDNIVSIYEDSFGELWIGTYGGINKFDRKTEKFIRYQHDPEDPTSLSNNKYCTIYESLTTGKSILWVGTNSGLNKFNRKTEKFTRYKHDRYNPNSLSHNLINYIFADASGILWIATQRGGLNKFCIETEQFTRFQEDPDNSKSISSNMVTSILEDKFQGKKVLWIATYNGLNKLDLETEKFTHYKHNPNNPQSLGDNNLNALYKDKTGTIWITTQGGGINKFDPVRQKFEHLQHEMGNSNSLSHNFICSITESKYYESNIFWIGTKDGGLNIYDRNTGSFIHYRHDPGNTNSLSSDFVITVLESQYQGQNELWIGTLDGLNKFDLNTQKFTCYQHDPNDPSTISNNLIRSLCEDKSGNLWIGTRNGGINRFDMNSGKFKRNKYYIGEALSIIEDNKGIIWAGTSRGLFQYNSYTDDFNHYKHDPNDQYSLSNNSVLSIHEDKFSRFWIGTRDGFHQYIRKTQKFARYKVKDGLPNNVINAILEDDHGNLWLSTNQGLSKFNPEQNIFRNYDINDGLQSSQFWIGASCLSKKGEMLFGGINGFNVFHPDSLKDNPYFPEIVITDFQIFNESVAIKKDDSIENNDVFSLSKHISALDEIVLSYRQNIFSFEFTALDYHSPQKNKYKYMMDGVDPDWVNTDASRRFATYTNLDPGEYTFTVKGSNNDGLWNEEGTSIIIIITPPWWKTNLAYILYVFLFGFIVFVIWRFQTNRLKMKHELELEHVHAEKLEEVDRIKSRFFANISHEFRTPLTLIKGPVQQLMSDEFRENIKEKYKMILRNSDRLLQLINQLLDLSKLESGKMKLQVSKIDIIQLMKGLVFSFASLAERKKITLKFSGKQKSLIGYIDCDKMEKIISNLLSNAFKFTPEGGKIGITVKIPNIKHQITNKFQIPNSDFVEITVTNTGHGIPTDCTNKIFDRFYQADDNYKKDSEGTGIGLALTKELVEVCYGEISVECKIIGENDKTKQPPFPLRRGIKGDVISKGDFKTTFTILLPVSKESFKEDEIIVAAAEDSPLEQGVAK